MEIQNKGFMKQISNNSCKLIIALMHPSNLFILPFMADLWLHPPSLSKKANAGVPLSTTHNPLAAQRPAAENCQVLSIGNCGAVIGLLTHRINLTLGNIWEHFLTLSFTLLPVVGSVAHLHGPESAHYKLNKLTSCTILGITTNGYM